MPKIDFLGKGEVYSHHLSVPYHTLEMDKKKSFGKTASMDGNLILQGDNLLALKALLPRYEGKVKCVYIDPPYNTGNEGWRFNDKMNSPIIKDWLNKTVDRDDQSRHDKWLCMMWPRLCLLKELLSEDGVIFISIDDNEQHRLRAIMDEIFGEENFINNVIWQKKHTRANDARYFSDTHDFVLVFAKSKENWKRNLLPKGEDSQTYSNPDNDPRGDWSSSPCQAKTYSAKMDYPITTPSGRVVNPPKGRSWVYTKERLEELIADNRIYFGEDGSNVPRYKRFRTEVKDGLVPITLWPHKEVGHNQFAKEQIKHIFSDTDLIYDTPKPTSLIDRILRIATDKDSLILDSFAGSGTTAQAVLELNKEDGGDRKFILVECEDDIAEEITAERVRRVIKGVKTAKSESLRTAWAALLLSPRSAKRLTLTKCSPAKPCRHGKRSPATPFGSPRASLSLKSQSRTGHGSSAKQRRRAFISSTSPILLSCEAMTLVCKRVSPKNSKRPAREASALSSMRQGLISARAICRKNLTSPFASCPTRSKSALTEPPHDAAAATISRRDAGNAGRFPRRARQAEGRGETSQ